MKALTLPILLIVFFCNGAAQKRLSPLHRPSQLIFGEFHIIGPHPTGFEDVEYIRADRIQTTAH